MNAAKGQSSAVESSMTGLSTTQQTVTTEDGRGLHLRRWGPKECQRAILCVHGLGEHSGCYDLFAKAMGDAGITTYAYDQHGHGKSPGVRGRAPDLDTFIDDIQTMAFHVTDAHADAEVILLGHSMGGHFVLRFLLDRNRPPIGRAIVTNPMILPKNPPTKAQSFAAWLTAKVIPKFRVSASMDATQLTQDEDILRRLAEDPLIHEKLSIGVGGELMSSGHRILETADQLDTDLLFMTGSDDDICDSDTNQQFAENAGTRCMMRSFDGLRHSLLLEKRRELVYASILDWLSGN